MKLSGDRSNSDMGKANRGRVDGRGHHQRSRVPGDQQGRAYLAGVVATSPSNALHDDWISRARILSGHSLTQRTETAICFWPWGPR